MLGRFQLEQVLGVGGMATVFRCRELRTGNEYAMKVLASNLARHEKIVARFRQEAAIQSRITHPGIVHVFELIEEGSAIGLVMEYVRGETLDDWLARLGRPTTTAECCDVFVPLLDALEFAHRAEVVHRDLKPSNVLLEAAAVPGGLWPKITDFGVARVLDEAGVRTATDAQLGTVEYMAPEQCRGGRGVDHRADIYSVGVMLYQACTGRLPFEGSEYTIMEGHLTRPSGRPSLLNPGMSTGLENTILRALEKAPGARFQSAVALRNALQMARFGLAGSAPDVSDAAAGPAVRAVVPVTADDEGSAEKGRTPAAWRDKHLVAKIGGLILAAAICAILLWLSSLLNSDRTPADSSGARDSGISWDFLDAGPPGSRADAGLRPQGGAIPADLTDAGTELIALLKLPACPPRGDVVAAGLLFQDGRRFQVSDQYDAAREKFGAAAAADPSNATYMSAFAYELLRAGQAVAALETARTAAGCVAAAVNLMRLADAYVQLGWDDLAVTAYEASLQDPTIGSGDLLKVSIRKGKFEWLALGDHERARSTWRLACPDAAADNQACKLLAAGPVESPTDRWRVHWGAGTP
ncbi:MAG: serine/threonine protein kinase [Deltaproteobacteria bacterium]|nr:serine/threonine protein kinase [Deltaproteobacteria bacterium]